MNLDKLEKDWTTYIQLFKYEDRYFTAREIVKITKTSWAQTNQTKYNKFRDPSKWSEIERIYQVEVVLAATLGKNHLITTDGAVLIAGTLKETCKNGLSVVNFMDNGITYSSVYRANLIMKKFMDPTFSITNGKVYYIDKDLNNATLDNIDFLDSSLRKQGKPKTKAKPKGSAAEDGNKYCY